MSKKIIAAVVVVALIASSIGGYAVFDAAYGNHNHGNVQFNDNNGGNDNNNGGKDNNNQGPNNNNNNGGDNNHSNAVLDLAGGYFDITDAATLSICTVDDQPTQVQVSQSAAVSTVRSTGGAVMPSLGCSIYSEGVSYEGFHNELHKSVADGSSEKVNFYADKEDMDGKEDPCDTAGNIVYLEKFGSLYFMAYYKHSIADIYRNLMGEDCDFWCTDNEMDFYMVDANTGKVFRITGLWCGCTAWRYQGTNDMISSLQYLGYYEGEEFFKVNVECNKYCTMPAGGTFRNIEGVVAFKSDGENLTHRLVMVDEDAMVKEFTGDKADENSWTQIEGKHKKYGYEMKMYENGLIRYVLITDCHGTNWQGSFTGDTYILTTDGESLLLDEWEECSDILCRSVVYDNTYFPVSMEVYDSDGSTRVVNCTAAESYQLASTNHYYGCIYREITETSTYVYIMHYNGIIDRLELRDTLEYSITPDIFGTTISVLADDDRNWADKDYIVYNSEIFYEPQPWSYSMYSYNTSVMIIGDKLYAVDGDVMKEYGLSNVSIEEYDIPSDTITKVRVDEYGHVFIEGYDAEERVCKLDLGEGGFQVSRSSIQVMTLKRVLGNVNDES